MGFYDEDIPLQPRLVFHPQDDGTLRTNAYFQIDEEEEISIEYKVCEGDLRNGVLKINGAHKWQDSDCYTVTVNRAQMVGMEVSGIDRDNVHQTWIINLYFFKWSTILQQHPRIGKWSTILQQHPRIGKWSTILQ
eukprot:154244_1